MLSPGDKNWQYLWLWIQSSPLCWMFWPLDYVRYLWRDQKIKLFIIDDHIQLNLYSIHDQLQCFIVKCLLTVRIWLNKQMWSIICFFLVCHCPEYLPLWTLKAISTNKTRWNNTHYCYTVFQKITFCWTNEPLSPAQPNRVPIFICRQLHILITELEWLQGRWPDQLLCCS